MGLTETEVNIIKIFADSREASSGFISNRVMITPGYADYLCKCLVRDGYLELAKHGTYRLTPKGSQTLRGRSLGLLWDQKTIQAIAKELAKELGTVAGVLPKTAQRIKRVVETGEPARKEIKIKESFISPLEDKVKLRHKFSQKLKESRASGAELEKTIKALKKIPKI